MPPASAITPFIPTTTPGVANPCTASSAVVVENAVPSRIARPSRARTPASVSPTATTAAVPAASSTGQKCASGVRSTRRLAVERQREQGHGRGKSREEVTGTDPVVPSAAHPKGYRPERDYF